MTENSGTNKKKLRILSYNVGLLRFRAFGISAFTLFSNPAYASQRFPHICKALQEYDDVDILVIQECYENKHIAELVKCLSAKYPYHAQVSSTSFSPLKFNNGMITFSKHPISNPKLHRLEKVSALEQHLANKSNLVCDIDIPDLGAFTVVHTHTTGMYSIAFLAVVSVVFQAIC
jgi:endonuclease/exonuclease/phosphatase family metal-dependent hydrolase